jgi:hypothetical protein
MDSKRVLFFTFLLVFLTACGEGGKLDQPATPTPLPTLAPGKAMVIGRVIADKSGQPISKQPVWLAEVRRQGDQAAFMLNTSSSPFSPTDQQGGFVIANVDPQEYVIVVGDPHSSDYEIIAESPDTARVWKLQADQTLDVGELRVWFGP